MTEPSLIRGGEKLTRLYGRWPSFHDAEVIAFTLEREESVARARIHVVEGHHVVVNLRFANVVDLELRGFNAQNAIFDLKIEPVSGHPEVNWEGPAYGVEFEPSYGIGASFVCSAVEVESVQPGLPPGSVYREGD